MKGEIKYEYVLPSDKFDVDSYFAEMATIVTDKGYNISVNNELKRLSIAYFKVYNHANIMAAAKVARLHFKDEGMEFHTDPLHKKAWVLGSKDKENIRELLMRKNDMVDGSSNWEVLCYRWNKDNNLIPSSGTFKEYILGNFDAKYADEEDLTVPKPYRSAYVPSTQEIPETWEM